MCFGDSLTAGYLQAGTQFHPYSDRLQTRLGAPWSVDHVGLSGWTTQQMIGAMDATTAGDVCGREWGGGLRTHMRRAADAGRPFRVLCLLAGTNDVGRVAEGVDGASVATVVEAISAMARAGREAGCRVVGMTIPAMAAEQHMPSLTQARESINQGVSALRAKGHFDALVQVAQGLPQEDDALWDDGLHPSRAGYDRIADLLYEEAIVAFREALADAGLV